MSDFRKGIVYGGVAIAVVLGLFYTGHWILGVLGCFLMMVAMRRAFPTYEYVRDSSESSRLHTNVTPGDPLYRGYAIIIGGAMVIAALFVGIKVLLYVIR